MTFSFLDTNALLTGPGGSVLLGNGSGSAEEGISFEDIEERDRMVVGADGMVMHSLIASRAGHARLRLLKVSPTNAQLMQMYNTQAASSLLWGSNTLTLTNAISGDVYTCSQVAFVRRPANNFAKEAGNLEWEFNCGVMTVVLGSNLASALASLA